MNSQNPYDNKFSNPLVHAILNGPVRKEHKPRVLSQNGRKDDLVGGYRKTKYRGGEGLPAFLDPLSSRGLL